MEATKAHTEKTAVGRLVLCKAFLASLRSALKRRRPPLWELLLRFCVRKTVPYLGTKLT